MHKRALPKDYDYFIALYARVVKFTCHFNNWLPAGAGSWFVYGKREGERTIETIARDGGEGTIRMRGMDAFQLINKSRRERARH